MQKYREANSEKIKAKRDVYRKIEMDCAFCECKTKIWRWKARIEAHKHKSNERIKGKEEEDPGQLTDEEKYYYVMSQKVKRIWNEVRL